MSIQNLSRKSLRENLRKTGQNRKTTMEVIHRRLSDIETHPAKGVFVLDACLLYHAANSCQGNGLRVNRLGVDERVGCTRILRKTNSFGRIRV